MTKLTSTTTLRIAAAGLLAALLIIIAISPSAGQATGKTGKTGKAAKTETLRLFSKPVSFTFTAADGTVSHRPPDGPPQAGDVLEIDSLDFAGDHRRHTKRPIGSDYLRCAFGAGPEPDCTSVAAIGGSLLRFRGSDLIGGTWRFQGATGKVLSNKQVEGGSDIVVRVDRP